MLPSSDKVLYSCLVVRLFGRVSDGKVETPASAFLGECILDLEDVVHELLGRVLSHLYVSLHFLHMAHSSTTRRREQVCVILRKSRKGGGISVACASSSDYRVAWCSVAPLRLRMRRIPATCWPRCLLRCASCLDYLHLCLLRLLRLQIATAVAGSNSIVKGLLKRFNHEANLCGDNPIPARH